MNLYKLHDKWREHACVRKNEARSLSQFMHGSHHCHFTTIPSLMHCWSVASPIIPAANWAFRETLSLSRWITMFLLSEWSIFTEPSTCLWMGQSQQHKELLQQSSSNYLLTVHFEEQCLCPAVLPHLFQQYEELFLGNIVYQPIHEWVYN